MRGASSLCTSSLPSLDVQRLHPRDYARPGVPTPSGGRGKASRDSPPGLTWRGGWAGASRTTRGHTNLPSSQGGTVAPAPPPPGTRRTPETLAPLGATVRPRQPQQLGWEAQGTPARPQGSL